MELTLEHLTLDPPATQSVVLIGLILTPRGCAGSTAGEITFRSWAFDPSDAVGDTGEPDDVGRLAIGDVLAEVDPDEWVVALFQAWEVPNPGNAAGVLAEVRERAAGTSLGKRLKTMRSWVEGDDPEELGHKEVFALLDGQWQRVSAGTTVDLWRPLNAIPNPGVATVGGQEVMGLLKNACRGRGTLIFESVYKIGPGIVAAGTATDERGRVTVELQWREGAGVTVPAENPTDTPWSPPEEGATGPGSTIPAGEPWIKEQPEPLLKIGAGESGDAAGYVWRHPKRWTEATADRAVRWPGKVDDFAGSATRIPPNLEHEGVVLVEKGHLGDFARLYDSERDVTFDASRLKDFEIREREDAPGAEE